MSIKLMTRVYEKQVDASLQRVLLVLCDHANDFGTECYPSIDYIAWKLGVNRKTVMRSITALEDAGVVKVDRKHRHNNRYTIYLERLPDKPPFDGGQNGTQESGDGQDVTQDGTKWDPIESPQMGLQPSVNHQIKPSGRTKRSQKPLPENGPAQKIVKAYCEAVGIDKPTDYGRAAGLAQKLADAGITPTDIPDLVGWLQTQPWVRGGITLNLLVNQADAWRTSRTLPPAPAQPSFGNGPQYVTAEPPGYEGLLRMREEARRKGLLP